MLMACDLMLDFDNDAVGGQCYTRTAGPVVGLAYVNFRQ